MSCSARCWLSMVGEGCVGLGLGNKVHLDDWFERYTGPVAQLVRALGS